MNVSNVQKSSRDEIMFRYMREFMLERHVVNIDIMGKPLIHITFEYLK
jgi:hypothetical protein